MPSFFVDRIPQTNEDHVVHRQGCSRMPRVPGRQFLGEFMSSQIALAEASRFFPRPLACALCLSDSYSR